MVGRPVSLKGHMHICPMIDPGPKPHIGGPVNSTQQSFVNVEGVPIATVGDTCLCAGVPTNDKIIAGSSVASINGKQISRLGDSCAHGGSLVQGVPWLTFE
ncbi:PAAR domain-containing protein [Agrobacterium salinitolerans]|uniref:PAAR domain-containing protein n=1 Tax=Agrobacterium salinitolerans TaxID=1183413 RepID=UPI0022B81B3C|nr:PAAR domain-containing protein [Agrobacterium salinitolerans]MCZ7856392.1 PAAR domain-containing protein [Agrobacterium salinitolerans]